MAQLVAPISDITNPITWNGTFADIDEASANDSDFGYCDDKATGTVEFKLGSFTDPLGSVGHIIRCRVSKTDGGVPNIAVGSGGNSTVTISLYQSTTLIQTLVTTHSVGLWEDLSYTISGSNADNITDYSDLRVRFDYVGGAGSPANRRGVAVSWLQGEVPSVAATTNVNASTLLSSFSLNSVSLTLISSIATGLLSSVFSLNSASVTTEASINVNTLSSAFTLNSASVPTESSTSVNVGVLSYNSSILNVSVNTLLNKSVNTLVGSYTLNPATVSTAQTLNVNANTLSSAFTLNSSFVVTEVNKSVGVLSFVSSINPVTVQTNSILNVNVNTLNSAFTLHGSTIETSSEVNVGVLQSVFTLNNVSIEVATEVNTSVLSGSFTLNSVSVNTNELRRVNAGILSGAFTLNSVTFGGDVVAINIGGEDMTTDDNLIGDQPRVYSF